MVLNSSIPQRDLGRLKKTFQTHNINIDNSSKLSFLYIGTNSSLVLTLSGQFQTGNMVETFEETVKFYTDLPREFYPKVVMIDLSFDDEKVSKFQRFFFKEKIQDSAVILYNSTKLQGFEIDYLKSYGLVDDIINLESNLETIIRKVTFFSKVKSSSSTLSSYFSEGTFNALSLQIRTKLLKRVIDICAATFAVIVLAPVFLAIAIAIKLDSKGPVIYTSLRAGRGFKIFRFFKFRTMVVDADKQIDEFAHLNQYSSSCGATFVKIANDPRVTSLGRFLRNTSLDELPQLFNVLIGDMSLVGNRPLPLYEAATLTTNEHVERFMAPAGITGLWQIKKRGRLQMSAEERIKLDISYARDSSVLYDMWIVALTPAALFQKSDA